MGTDSNLRAVTADPQPIALAERLDKGFGELAVSRQIAHGLHHERGRDGLPIDGELVNRKRRLLFSNLEFVFPDVREKLTVAVTDRDFDHGEIDVGTKDRLLCLLLGSGKQRPGHYHDTNQAATPA
jgi:hypothetical protein